MRRALFCCSLTILATAGPASAVVVDWSQATSWDASNTAFDPTAVTTTGQTFVNVAGTGLTVVVTGVGNLVPTPGLVAGNIRLQDTLVSTDPSITLTFTNGTADVTLSELANLQASETQGVSNPDSIDMFVTQTADAGGLMFVNTVQVPGLNMSVNAGANATITGALDVAGTSFDVDIGDTTGVSWSFASSFQQGSANTYQLEITDVQLASEVPAVQLPGKALLAALLLATSWRALSRRIA